jgi:amino acid transporter
VVGGTIGVSIFVVPAGVANEVGAPGLALATWGLTGLLALAGALAFAELAAAMPETGGTYVFLKRSYPGTPIAFLFGWMLFFTHSTGSIAVVASMGSLYAGHFLGKVVPFEGFAVRVLAVGMITLLTALNVAGVKAGARAQTALTAVKVALLLVVILACALSSVGDPGRFRPLLPEGRSPLELSESVATAMILSIFSFSGWFFVTHVAGEVKEPERTLPRSIILSIGIVLAVYLAINAALIYVLPFEELRASPRVAAAAMERVLGPVAADLTALVILTSSASTLSAQLLNYPRVTFALARDGLFFRRLARVDPVRRTPVAAIVVVGVWASLFALAGTFTQILSAVSFVYQTFMALTVLGLLVLRRREPGLPRPYRVIGYPFTPLLYLAILAWYLTSVIRQRPVPTLLGIAIVLLGLPFYFYWRGRPAAA